ncbi:uncharacterized protein [Atheta coriaria]|uniref:uncharacterized protein isoform X1 n=1 Tax=Dalotia coriaria TaxID=877792 RepID=UPI0031F4738C
MFEGLRCFLSVDTLLVPLYTYCGAKLVFRLSNDDHITKIIFVALLRLLFTLVVTPLLLVAFLLFSILADVVRFIAKLYFRGDFVDFATGGDAMYSDDHRIGKGIIPAVYYIEEKYADSAHLLMEHIKSASLKAQTNHPRLRCIQKKFLCYIFFLRSPPIGLDFITYFDDYKSDDDFQNILNEKIGSVLPLNNTFLWEITIGKKSVKVQDKNCIPLLFRLHHSLGDGVTLMTLLMTNYAENGCENIRVLCDNLKKLQMRGTSKKSPKRMYNVIDDFMKSLLTFINYIWNKEFYFGFDFLRDAEVKYSWHNEPSGDISLHMVGIDQNKQFVEKVKEIKNKLNVSFNDVILGVIAASFTKHFLQNKQVCPPTIVTLNPYNLNANNFNDLLSFNALKEPVTKLGNKFTIGMISLPIKEEYLKDPKMFITEQHKITKYLKHSVDFQYMFWMVHKIVSIVPLPIVIPLHNLYRPSTLVTNLPPLTAVRIIDHDIVDMMLSSVHCYDVSTCISIFSYNNNFHVSTMMDKNCINFEQQKIFSNNIFDFVDQIYEKL